MTRCQGRRLVLLPDGVVFTWVLLAVLEHTSLVLADAGGIVDRVGLLVPPANIEGVRMSTGKTT